MSKPKLWKRPELTQTEMFPGPVTSFRRRFNAFLDFHLDNPHIYQLILDRCNEMMAVGVEHYSIECILNRIRWDYDIGVHKDKSGFKFSNNHKSFYARLIEDNNPHLKGFFGMRENKEMDNLRRQS